MDPNHPDHVGRILGTRDGRDHVLVPPEDVPVEFTHDQLEHLEKVFGPEAQLTLVKVHADDHAQLPRRVGQGEGYARILAHVRSRTKGAS